MSFEDCVAKLKEVAPSLDEEELVDLLTIVQTEAKKLRAKNTALTPGESLLEAANSHSERVMAREMIEKRNAALNYIAKTNLVAFADKFKSNPADAFEARMSGISSTVEGSRDNCDSYQKGLYAQYQGAVVSKLERENLTPILASGQLDEQIFYEMIAITDQTHGSPGHTGSPEAAKIAAILHETSEVARTDMNKAGAWIKPLPGWAVRQSHDMHKIREAGSSAWVSAIKSRLDPEKTFEREQHDFDVLMTRKMSLTNRLKALTQKAGALKRSKDKSELPMVQSQIKQLEDDLTIISEEQATIKTSIDDPDKFLAAEYHDLSSGIHTRTTGAAPAMKGFGNRGRAASMDRIFHFKSPQDAYWYMQNFGHGSLRDAYFSGLHRSANNTGLMKYFGPNAYSNFDSAITEVSNKLEGSLRDKFAEKRKGLENIFRTLDGSTEVNGGNNVFEKFSRAMRQFNTIRMMGMSAISSIPDVVYYGSEMKYQGRSMLSSTAEAIGSIFKGRPDGWKRELAGQLGVVHESLIGNITSRFSGDTDMNGMLAKGVRWMYKLNLEAYKSEVLRSSAVFGMSNRLAYNKNNPFGKMDPDLERVLGLFNITAENWEIMRTHAVVKEPGTGREFLTPEALADAPDEVFAGSPAAAQVAREELQRKLLSYFTDRMNLAVVDPSARNKALMLMGSQRGTVEGEFWRHFMQLKSFTFAFTQNVIGREIYGREGTLSSAMGLARLFVGATIAGYVVLAVKDLLSGKTVRDPFDSKTLVSAVMAGGGAGFYADMVLGNIGGWGKGLLDSLAGPTFGTIGNAYNIVKNARTNIIDGEGIKGVDQAKADLVKFGTKMLPYSNMWFNKLAIDYLVLYQAQEAINPGYMNKMQRRMARETEQEFYLEPPQ